MSRTQKLLDEAQDLARRQFESPSEATVMQLFARLCDEVDRDLETAWVENDLGTLH